MDKISNSKMPNRAVRKNSVVDLLAKVPVNKGSLLTSLENLLKTIESSESAVMIPTLLRDKCEFDAWELLFVAKILKASILGHVDLVEFYMNHIGLNSSQFAASQTSNTTTTTNGITPTGTTPTNSIIIDQPINQSLSPSTTTTTTTTPSNGHTDFLFSKRNQYLVNGEIARMVTLYDNLMYRPSSNELVTKRRY